MWTIKAQPTEVHNITSTSTSTSDICIFWMGRLRAGFLNLKSSTIAD